MFNWYMSMMSASIIMRSKGCLLSSGGVPEPDNILSCLIASVRAGSAVSRGNWLEFPNSALGQSYVIGAVANMPQVLDESEVICTISMKFPIAKRQIFPPWDLVFKKGMANRTLKK